MALKTIIIILSLIVGISNGFGAMSDLRDVSVENKVYYLSRIWKDIDYNFPFISEFETFELDEIYQEHLKMAMETDNLYDYYRVLQRFMAQFNDCNTRIVLPQAISSNINYPLIQLRDMNDKVIITNIGKRYSDTVPIGSELLEVNNLPVNRYIETEVTPYISASNETVLRQRSLLFAFVGIKDSSIAIKARTPDGEKVELSLTKNWDGDSWDDFMWQKEVMHYDWLEDGIALIEINRFDDPRIDKEFGFIYNHVKDEAKAIVLDMRYNQTGNLDIAYQIMRHFIDIDKLPYAHIKSLKHIPLYRAMGTASPWHGIPANPEYESYAQRKEMITEEPPSLENDPNLKKLILPTVILTGPKTATPAEDFAMVLRDYRDDVKIMGQNTPGRRGHSMVIHLPYMGQAWINTSKDYRPDGRLLSRKGISPDVEVKQTLEDFTNDKDTAIQKAVEYLRSVID